ncbi:unnamed protein product [Moneuplotes crassus]|uniref:Uncharacterized protein n=2 Tax=Euplotes crassus TaxID=5936 RepID=A0AAD1XNG9_EUPCR|nr:unnamed protein product [Moneuplotes crassus]
MMMHFNSEATEGDLTDDFEGGFHEQADGKKQKKEDLKQEFTCDLSQESEEELEFVGEQESEFDNFSTDSEGDCDQNKWRKRRTIEETDHLNSSSNGSYKTVYRKVCCFQNDPVDEIIGLEWKPSQLLESRVKLKVMTKNELKGLLNKHPENSEKDMKKLSLLRKKAKFPSLLIDENILDKYKPDGSSISARYHHVPLDFSSQRSRELIFKEIERIKTNFELREEEVKKLMSLRYRMGSYNLLNYNSQIFKMMVTWTIMQAYLEQLKKWEEEVTWRDHWSSKDIAELIKLQEKYAGNWAKIATQLGRHSLACKEKFNSLSLKVKRGEWTYQETGTLLELISKFGKNFALISKKMRNRSRIQIRDRVAYLEKTKLLKFDSRMEAKLCSKAIKYGKDWKEISKNEFPDIMPSILMMKYNEIIHRDEETKINNFGQGMQFGGYEKTDEKVETAINSSKDHSMDNQSDNENIQEIGNQSVVKRRNSCSQWEEIIKIDENSDESYLINENREDELIDLFTKKDSAAKRVGTLRAPANFSWQDITS